MLTSIENVTILPENSLQNCLGGRVHCTVSVSRIPLLVEPIGGGGGGGDGLRRWDIGVGKGRGRRE